MTVVSIPVVDTPVVSVVLLAWRLSEPLIAAVESVVNSINAPPYEVIIVLNGALDSVRTAVQTRIIGARIVDLKANTGFGEGCNRGAAVARGEYILLVNDDATIHSETMRRLVDTMESSPTDENIGAVASVLINADGTVQEAGSRMLSSGGTVQLGAGLDLASAHAEPFLQRRWVDYGSGATLLVRRALFERVGGYDSRYRPAYYEDADLAFRFTALGYRTLLEPLARATHLSGASTATDLRFRRYAADRSGQAFIARWATVLSTAPREQDPPDLLCSIPALTLPEVRASQPLAAPTAEHIALNIAADYAAWLNVELDRSESENVTLQLNLHSLGHEHNALLVAEGGLNEATAARDAAAEEASGLKLRLIDLEQRGPIGIVRWRVGAALLRRAERRAQRNWTNG